MSVKKIPKAIRAKIEKVGVYGMPCCATTVLKIEIKKGKKLADKEGEGLVRIFKGASSAKKAYIMRYYGDDKNCHFLHLEDLNLDKLKKFLEKL